MQRSAPPILSYAVECSSAPFKILIKRQEDKAAIAVPTAKAFLIVRPFAYVAAKARPLKNTQASQAKPAAFRLLSACFVFFKGFGY